MIGIVKRIPCGSIPAWFVEMCDLVVNKGEEDRHFDAWHGVCKKHGLKAEDMTIGTKRQFVLFDEGGGSICGRVFCDFTKNTMPMTDVRLVGDVGQENKLWHIVKGIYGVVK